MQQALENCENGAETAKEQGCSLDCPMLQIAGATPHPEFFGILRCLWATLVWCFFVGDDCFIWIFWTKHPRKNTLNYGTCNIRMLVSCRHGLPPQCPDDLRKLKFLWEEMEPWGETIFSNMFFLSLQNALPNTELLYIKKGGWSCIGKKNIFFVVWNSTFPATCLLSKISTLKDYSIDFDLLRVSLDFSTSNLSYIIYIILNHKRYTPVI